MTAFKLTSVAAAMALPVWASWLDAGVVTAAVCGLVAYFLGVASMETEDG